MASEIDEACSVKDCPERGYYRVVLFLAGVPTIELDAVRVCESHRRLPARAILTDDGKRALEKLLVKRGYGLPDWSTYRMQFVTDAGVYLAHHERTCL